MSRRARTRAAGLIVVGTMLVAGCGGARNSLGTAASPCFRALPPAVQAVNGKGKLLGVTKTDTDLLQQKLPGNHSLAAATSKDLCVFAFRASYQPADVPLAGAKHPGSYALVAVSIRHPTVVAAFILDRLPIRFGHLR